MEKPTPEESPQNKDKSKSVLGLTMLAVGRIIEPTKTSVDVEVVAETDGDPQDDLLKELGVTFGDLEPLEELSEYDA